MSAPIACRHCGRAITRGPDGYWRDDDADPGDGYGGDASCPARDAEREHNADKRALPHEPREVTYVSLTYWHGDANVWRVIDDDAELGLAVENVSDWRGLRHVHVNHDLATKLERVDALERMRAWMLAHPTPAPIVARDDATPYWYTDPADSTCDYCEEGEEYGAHFHALYVTRDGASARTADSLARVLCDDAADLTTYKVPTDLPDPDGWCEEEEQSSYLYEESERARSGLYDAGYYVSMDDGYVIGRVYVLEDDPAPQTSHDVGDSPYIGR